MTVNQKTLWNKINSFQLDDPESSFTFSHRLARENGWTKSYSEKVIEEYKKFIFLCCISETTVTPSDQVDQVWHLHLTYTRSYWVDLCRNTLSKEIHHNPTKGGNLEGKKFDDLYTETRVLYQQIFKKEAPIDIWPDNEERFSDIHYQRINTKRNWVLRKPNFKGKNTTILLLLGASFFFIQSHSDGGTMIEVLIAILFMGFLIKGNGGKGGGSSSGGCGGDSGHSGCGGDSGCSGCGGCGGD